MGEKIELDFDGQRPDENTLFVFRRSLFVIKKGICILVLLIAITGVPLLLWQNIFSSMWWLPLIGFIAGLLYLMYRIFIWYFTVYIVTDQRLRCINQKGLFSSEVVDLPLSKIENISYNVPGLLGSVVGFGTIAIQTLAGDLVIHRVSHPEIVYNRLQDLTATQTVDKDE